LSISTLPDKGEESLDPSTKKQLNSRRVGGEPLLELAHQSTQDTDQQFTVGHDNKSVGFRKEHSSSEE